MISRYTLPEMGAIWSEERKVETWLRVEILACEAWAKLGRIPEDDLAAIRERAAATPEEVREAEEVTNHDVAAFVEVASEKAGPAGRWIHYGLTSSDVLDTALAVRLRDACAILDRKLAGLFRVVRDRALEHRHTVCLGRTHGIAAEPTTFGHKLAVWAFELRRDRERLHRAARAVAVGKVSGAVGTYSVVDPFVEQHVCEGLGLATAEASTQVLQRDRHAELLAAIAITGATLEKMAVEIRHLARTEVREVQEPFGEGQKGSSSMPHKRNPILSERVAGIARLLRANLQAGLENVALWHERDISHSSVERVVLPDATIALDYALHLMRRVIEGLVVFPDRMREKLAVGGGLVFSQAVLTTLIDAGMTRDEAYAIVQAAAAKAWDEGATFRTEIEGDPKVKELLAPEELSTAFEPRLQHLDAVFERLEQTKGTADEGGVDG